MVAITAVESEPGAQNIEGTAWYNRWVHAAQTLHDLLEQMPPAYPSEDEVRSLNRALHSFRLGAEQMHEYGYDGMFASVLYDAMVASGHRMLEQDALYPDDTDFDG